MCQLKTLNHKNRVTLGDDVNVHDEIRNLKSLGKFLPNQTGVVGLVSLMPQPWVQVSFETKECRFMSRVCVSCVSNLLVIYYSSFMSYIFFKVVAYFR